MAQLWQDVAQMRTIFDGHQVPRAIFSWNEMNTVFVMFTHYVSEFFV